VPERFGIARLPISRRRRPHSTRSSPPDDPRRSAGPEERSSSSVTEARGEGNQRGIGETLAAKQKHEVREPAARMRSNAITIQCLAEVEAADFRTKSAESGSMSIRLSWRRLLPHEQSSPAD
jgi:hypothetical protein